MKKTIILLTILAVSNSLISQVSTKETKGTKYYNNFTFDKSIEKLEEVGIENLTTNGLRNLADAYRYTHKTIESENYYSVLVTKPDNKAEDLLMYSEMLEMNKKHNEAELWMDKFHVRLKEDSRGKEYAAKKGEYKKLQIDNQKFEIFNLDINTNKEDFGPAFYINKVVFASSRKNNFAIKRIWNWNNYPFLNIYEADLTENKKLENVNRLSKKINKKYHEGPASFSEDGKLMIFTRNNYEEKSINGETKLTMFYREKDEEGEWGDIIPFNFNNKEYSVGHPALSPDGKTLYFASDMPGGIGSTDLYKIERKDNSWTIPVNLGNVINSEGKEMFPFYHKNDMLFFASEGHVGLGGLDIFISKIGEDGSYGEIMNLGYPLNDSKDDFGFILDKEQNFGFFSSNRDGGNGSDDIYAFNLLKPFVFCKEIKGLALDNDNNTLPGTEVILTNNAGDVIAIDTVGENAAYSFCVEPGDYIIKGTKTNYFDGTNSANPNKESQPITANVILENIPDFDLYALITDKKTELPLQDVKVILINNLTNTKDTINTPSSGDFKRPILDKKINDNISYQLVLEKEGYLSKTVTYNKKLETPGLYKVDADLAMEPLEVGGDLSKLIEINPIYFDLNKSFIRPDAAIELDKIVAVMNEYPGMYIELGSHTDCRASKSYNEALSDRRAKSSAKYIASKITKPERIYGKGYGEELLINHCECEGAKKVPCTEDEHQVNRRTEFKIIKFEAEGVKVKANGPQSFDK
jgi:outer membrane protein OmpA-like peptidoglycan-associated protein